MSLQINPGDVIDGKYVIERLLGQGGMGAVFLAREDRLGRRVAIKLLLPAVASNPEAVTRFEREARAAAALQSDHVTRVLSVGHVEGGAPYIVMELLDGEDLAAVLRNRGPLPLQDVIGIMVQACDALAEAHALGIVHRDLKPANIFLARRANGTTSVKVLDFGISKTLGGAPAAALTSTSALMGSPLYMSPEQLREARNVDGRADIWALGVTMYELLTGAVPFSAEALAEICTLILTANPAPVRARRPDLPPAIDAILDRCLRKDPSQRFATIGELVAALESLRSPSQVSLGSTQPQPAQTAPGAPRPVAAGTIDPLSTTSGKAWLEPRPNVTGVVVAICALVFVGGVGTFGAFAYRSHAAASANDANDAGASVTPASVASSSAATSASSAAPAIAPSAAPVTPPPAASSAAPVTPPPVTPPPASPARPPASPLATTPTARPTAPPASPATVPPVPARPAPSAPPSKPDFPMPSDRR